MKYTVRCFQFLLLIAAAVGTHKLAANPENEQLTVAINAASAPEKMGLALAAIAPTSELHIAADRIQHNLGWEHQQKTGFKIHPFIFSAVPSRGNIRAFSHENIPLALLIRHTAPDIWQWWIYNTASLAILESKKMHITKPPREAADLISDAIWEALTGQEGIFSTRIAFCKEIRLKNGIVKHLCIIAPQDAQAITIVRRGKPVAPRWHSDPAQRTIFYSAITHTNMQLKGITLEGKQFNVSNFDGLNLLPSFSPNGKIMVYCRSDEGSMGLFSCTRQSDGFSQCRKIKLPIGNNISPVALDSGDIIFCSDAVRNTPRIYQYHAETEQIQPLTDGYCAAPAWCAASNQLAYCKLVKGALQIFTCDLGAKKHTQLTFSPGDKDECSWSPGGSYITFAHNDRVAILNTITKETFYITAANERCGYPAWSPRFLAQNHPFH